MVWYSPREDLPPMPKEKWLSGEPFLGVFKGVPANTFFFYVVSAEYHDSSVRYVEAGGEQYCWFDESELVAWTSINELTEDLLRTKPELSFY